MLHFLYHTAIGRLLLKPLCAPWLSEKAGAFLNTGISRILIDPFVKKNGIDLSEYESDHFRCFNDCFSRQIKPGRRPICLKAEALIAPCDGLLSVYPIREGSVFPVKQSFYTIEDLLNRDPCAKDFEGGTCLVFRLCVNHYHRYCYPDDARKGKNVFIPGRLHTVRPVALAARPVFVQNSREYTLLQTQNFGEVLQMEVGAMLVGKIKNYESGEATVKRGQEKGMFLYGGSTIILLLANDQVRLRKEITEASAQGREFPVKMGEQIGEAAAKQKFVG